jgi:hypothetical protein
VSIVLSLGTPPLATVRVACSVVHAAGIVGSGGKLLSPAPHAFGSTEVLDVVLALAVDVALLVEPLEPDAPPLLPLAALPDDDVRSLADVVAEPLAPLSFASLPPDPQAPQAIAQASAPNVDPIRRNCTIDHSPEPCGATDGARTSR